MIKCTSCDLPASYLLTSPADVWELVCEEHENEYAREFGEDMVDKFEIPLSESALQNLLGLLNKREQRMLWLLDNAKAQARSPASLTKASRRDADTVF